MSQLNDQYYDLNLYSILFTISCNTHQLVPYFYDIASSSIKQSHVLVQR